MTTLILVRHGATDWNVAARAQGHADVELNDLGRAQALAAAERLAAVEVDAVFSSDLRRALDTAGPIAAAHGLTVVADPAFREIDQGEWTGLTEQEIRLRWSELLWRERHHSTRPGGESPAEVRERALRGLARLVEDHPSGSVVVVSHGVTIRTLIAEAEGAEDLASVRVAGLVNGGIVSMNARQLDARVELDDPIRWDGVAPHRDDPNQ
jgi:broad specificity phosphatase PhoE